jgi:hypothetical protein
MVFLPEGIVAQQNINIYKFPIQRGSSEWKQMTDQKQRIIVCQIPDSILKRITTSDLLESCLSYPLITDMFYYNDSETGF